MSGKRVFRIKPKKMHCGISNYLIKSQMLTYEEKFLSKAYFLGYIHIYIYIHVYEIMIVLGLYSRIMLN